MGQAQAQAVELHQGDALLVIDMQNDFLPGGTLPVAEGDRVIAPLNRYLESFQDHHLPVFASRDWHPADHRSFQAQGGPWPPHCVQGSKGAEFVGQIDFPEDVTVFSTGFFPELEGYSAFEATDLDQTLRGSGVKRLFIGGLATDYCVLRTVKEARLQGYDVWLLEDAIRAVNAAPDDGAKAIDEMRAAGVHLYAGELK